MDLLERFRGAIFGLAIGDALGHPAEFVASLPSIRAKWGPRGITGFEPAGRHPAGTFTDDTQMTLAVARALCRADLGDLDGLMTVMASEFVAWSRSALNNRAPGGTCLAACRNLARGVAWRESGVKGSKGCGAAMRAAPVGLVFHADVDALVRVSAAQSVLTHSHPTGVASSVAAAAAAAWAARGGEPDGLLAFVRRCVAMLTLEVLVDVGCDPRLAARLGVGEMLDAIDGASAAVGRESEDVCSLLGGAWVGDEAVACALWCALRAGGDYRDAVLRGANSSGDSDSIACIAGGVAGAWAGLGGLPEGWVAGVERAAVLDRIALELHRVATGGAPRGRLDPALDLFGAERLGVRPEDVEGEEDTVIDRAPSFLLQLSPPAEGRRGQ